MATVRHMSLYVIACLFAAASCTVESDNEPEPAQASTSYAPEQKSQDTQITIRDPQITVEVHEGKPPLPYPDTPPFGPDILSIDFLEELPPGSDTDYAVVQGEPLVGPGMLRISFAHSANFAWAENVSVELMSLDRLATFGKFKMATNGPSGAPIGDYFGEVINPSEPYRLKVTGQSKKRRPFQIYYPRIFKPVQGPAAKADPEQFGPPSGTTRLV